MKANKIILAMVIASMTVSANAQQVTVEEPEFMNSYCLLTSDSTYKVLPKETGMIKQHKSLFKKVTEIAGKVADVAGGVGGIVTANAGSITGAIDGIKTMGTAANAGGIADAIGGLAAANGQDIVFKGGSSPFVIPSEMKTVRLVIKAPNNENDPMELYRIVRFDASKKQRKVKWLEFNSSLIGSLDTEKDGYVNFTGHKYGNQSYLLTIPENELKPGEYGIFYMSIASATDVPVGTFSVR